MSLFCLDSHILIWGIKEEATPGQEPMVPKAKAFFEYLENDNAKVIVPSVVVAELLIKIPSSLHPMVTNLMQRTFIVPPFDLKAAMHFAKIWQEKKEQQVIQELDGTRQELKADCMIVAIAVAQNATCLLSYDDNLKKFAEGYIEVRKLPNLGYQTSLFK